jgi:hypothetical protein
VKRGATCWGHRKSRATRHAPMTIEKDSPARPCGGAWAGCVQCICSWWWPGGAGPPLVYPVPRPPSRGSGLGRNLAFACNKRQTIDGYLALTRWADPGTARKSTVQPRHGPVSIVPVPGTARL